MPFIQPNFKVDLWATQWQRILLTAIFELSFQSSNKCDASLKWKHPFENPTLHISSLTAFHCHPWQSWWHSLCMKEHWGGGMKCHVTTLGFWNKKKSQENNWTWECQTHKSDSHACTTARIAESQTIFLQNVLLLQVFHNVGHVLMSCVGILMSDMCRQKIPSVVGWFLLAKTWLHSLPVKCSEHLSKTPPALDHWIQLSVTLSDLHGLAFHSQWCPLGPFQSDSLAEIDAKKSLLFESHQWFQTMISHAPPGCPFQIDKMASLLHFTCFSPGFFFPHSWDPVEPLSNFPCSEHLQACSLKGDCVSGSLLRKWHFQQRASGMQCQCNWEQLCCLWGICPWQCLVLWQFVGEHLVPCLGSAGICHFLWLCTPHGELFCGCHSDLFWQLTRHIKWNDQWFCECSLAWVKKSLRKMIRWVIFGFLWVKILLRQENIHRTSSHFTWCAVSILGSVLRRPNDFSRKTAWENCFQKARNRRPKRCRRLHRGAQDCMRVFKTADVLAHALVWHIKRFPHWLRQLNLKSQMPFQSHPKKVHCEGCTVAKNDRSRVQLPGFRAPPQSSCIV